ncbi:hypothetical protein [Haloparvum sp. PAK95]|uniref:hypothetical protein n=1 Tax=Haloparvum sp. PAK95 TaxID=3418962 RepID=UPI003D2F1E05
MSHRKKISQGILTIFGLLFLTSAWSLPTLVKHDFLPRGWYLLTVIPFLSVVGLVYVTTAVWQYLLTLRKQSSYSPHGIGLGIGAAVTLGAIIASGWTLASVIPPLRVFINEWQTLLPPATLLTWFPAGDMLEADRMEWGVVLLGVPLIIVGISSALVGIWSIWMVMYLIVCALVGLPVLLLGFARNPT